MKPAAVRLFEAGFRRIVSVIPPNAPLSPASKILPSQRGKSPGRRNANGTWGGYDWLKYEPTIADVKRWSNDQSNIGLIADQWPGVDIDTLDPWLAQVMQDVAIEILGPAPCRVGRAPKRLLMYRTELPFARLALIVTKDGQRHLIEVLGRGRQYLIEGLHPCGTRYTWDRDITAINPETDLTCITVEKVRFYFDTLADRLEMLDMSVERVGDGAVRERAAQPQADLLAPSIAALQTAVALLPNTDDVFPGREDYIKVAYAIRAAAGENDEVAGFEVFAEWASRHEGDGRVEGNPDTWRADWRRLHPPYSVGWTWLAELASGFGFARAAYEFEADKVAGAQEQDARDEGPPAYSDQWLAERVLDESGDQLRYVHAFSKWYVWNGSRWVADATLLADHLIGQALRRQAAIVIRRGATQQEQRLFAKLADDMCSSQRLGAVRTILRADPRIAAPVDAFDADPWLLNTPAGTVDLRTGSLQDPNPATMCSRQTVCAPDFETAAPTWMKFLRETTGGDQALELYLRRLAGYALTGITDEQMLGFIWGEGGNGKSKFIGALTHCLQDYAVVAPMETFVASTHDRHPTDIAGLAGARLVVASETQSGRHWDEQRLKNLTGGDPIRARYMRQDFFTYQPQFTLLVYGNHKPQITHLDAALRRRIHMVPFTCTPPHEDHQLGEKLQAEAPAILAWMIRGCVDWRDTGLLPPACVVAATQEYFEEEDAVGAFLSEKVVRVSDSTAPVDQVYRAWLEWSNRRGEQAGSQKRFIQMLQAHHIEHAKDKAGRRVLLGITIPDNLQEGIL